MTNKETNIDFKINIVTWSSCLTKIQTFFLEVELDYNAYANRELFP
jgi:hypothetical protein